MNQLICDGGCFSELSSSQHLLHHRVVVLKSSSSSSSVLFSSLGGVLWRSRRLTHPRIRSAESERVHKNLQIPRHCSNSDIPGAGNACDSNMRKRMLVQSSSYSTPFSSPSVTSCCRRELMNEMKGKNNWQFGKNAGGEEKRNFAGLMVRWRRGGAELCFFL